MQLRSTEINIYKVKRIAVQWQNEKDGYNGPAYIRKNEKPVPSWYLEQGCAAPY